MPKLTTNFALSEFASHDGAPFPDDVLHNLQELANNLQVLRDYLGVPLTINSGYRSPAYNAKIRGAVSNSQHILGKAADLSSVSATPAEIEAAILLLISQGKMKQGGVGIYDNWLHYDIRGTKARWDFRTKK